MNATLPATLPTVFVIVTSRRRKIGLYTFRRGKSAVNDVPLRDDSGTFVGVLRESQAVWVPSVDGADLADRFTVPHRRIP
jgi:hypothetical protein